MLLKIHRKVDYKIKEDDREFLDFIPPVSILLSGIIFIFGTLTAVFIYETPNGKYQFLNQFFSELGVRFDFINSRNELIYAPAHPDVFNITLYASGFLMIPFFMFSYRQMRNSNRVSRFFLLLATLSGMVAGPMLIGVGIFDLSSKGSEIWMDHGFWVGILYILLTSTSILWFLMLLTSSHLPYRRNTRWIWLDYAFLIGLSILTSLNILDGLNIIFVSDIPLLSVFPIETYQKVIAYLFFMYYGLVVGIRLSKTKYDNTPIKHKGTGHAEKKGDTLWYCTNCGEENPKDTKFCNECGLKLN